MAEKTALLNVVIHGELTISTAAGVRDDLLAALDAADEVEVDLTRVTEIDSAGIQIMVGAKREASERRKSLRFLGHSAAVVDALDLTDLAGYLGDPVVLQSRHRERPH
ncbi:MAG TPA: STAS domain-containing protein [Rhodocyclaceae bacterium]